MAFQGRSRRRASDVLKGVDKLDYKNTELLERFLEDGGRLRSRRRTRTAARSQRLVTQAVKRARHVALLPYTAEQERLTRTRSGRRGRRDDRGDRSDRRDRGGRGGGEDRDERDDRDDFDDGDDREDRRSRRDRGDRVERERDNRDD